MELNGDSCSSEEKNTSTGRRELVSLSDPDAGTSSMEYDGFGQVRRTLNAMGEVTTTPDEGIDVLGRVMKKSTAAGDYTTVNDTLPGAPNGMWTGVAASSTVLS